MLHEAASQSQSIASQASVDVESGGPARPLSRWQKHGLVLLAVATVAFGVVTEVRTALLEHRKGDLGVFLRAAWAIRAGSDVYDITDDNGFHYLYPPLFAILLTPLADAPAGAERIATLPYAASAGICYVLNLLCLLVAVHWLASALEGAGPLRRLQRGSRSWWGLRVLPILVCLPPIGHTLVRGQVNLLLLLLLSGTISAALRGRSGRAGLWLAGAICLKVIPAFLLVYPLWRRDRRMLAGCALGLVLGLVAIPAVVLEPARTADCYRAWTRVMLLPAFDQGEDRSRAKELMEMTATDSQSLLVVMHNTLHPNRFTRPRKAEFSTRAAALCVGGLLTALTLLAAGYRGRLDAASEVIFFGMLVLDMLLLSPVCHLHYFCLSLPLVAGLIAIRMQDQAGGTEMRWLPFLFAFNVIANTLPHFPGLEPVRDLGLAMYAALTLWLAGAAVLIGTRRQAARMTHTSEVSAAA